MKQYFSLLLIFVLMGWSPHVFGANAKPLGSPDKPIRVALLIDKMDMFWTHFVRIMNVAANQLKMDVQVYHGHESHLAMIQKAEQLALSPDRPDVLMFKSFKGNGPQIMQMAARHQVKTFAVNASLELKPGEAAAWPHLIGELLPDDVQAGYELVKALRAEMRNKNIAHVHLIAINGDQADSPARLRAIGLRRAVSEFKDITLHQVIADAWTAPTAPEQFELLKKRYPMINAVWAGNDAIALRVVEKAKTMDYVLGQNLFIGGIDSSPEGLAAIKKREMVTSVGGHILDGARSLIVLYDYFKLGQFKEKLWMTPMVPVTLANVDAYRRIIDPQSSTPVDFTQYSKWLHPKASYDFNFLKD
ncbi:MAG TPA: ABC transporter substrate-binding protein [Oligoflexus sp.]|uniref:ABC transporter substrate-binding protein n=1 Tax=Oligoflexus sp. TaxID=1971216 RepID=UPI002D36057F|nr:ABC transporter substrate-binding protein [Oligoflexus sp.]HYX33875.1 ABC transporter substrate-binding protein [Oligoflexus sp.]